MSTLQIPRSYYTLFEVRTRWHIPDHSPDIERLVMDGTLKPCLMLRGALYPVEVRDGQAVVLRDELESVDGVWLYPTFPRQVGPFDCVYECVSDTALPVAGATLWGLPDPLTLSQVMDSAVVMAEDVREAEEVLRDKQRLADEELSTKQERTRDKLIVALSAEILGWDPGSDRPESLPHATRLVGVAEAWGLKLSVNTVKDHLRMAWERCQPKL